MIVIRAIIKIITYIQHIITDNKVIAAVSSIHHSFMFPLFLHKKLLCTLSWQPKQLGRKEGRKAARDGQKSPVSFSPSPYDCVRRPQSKRIWWIRWSKRSSRVQWNSIVCCPVAPALSSRRHFGILETEIEVFIASVRLSELRLLVLSMDFMLAIVIHGLVIAFICLLVRVLHAPRISLSPDAPSLSRCSIETFGWGFRCCCCWCACACVFPIRALACSLCVLWFINRWKKRGGFHRLGDWETGEVVWARMMLHVLEP